MGVQLEVTARAEEVLGEMGKKPLAAYIRISAGTSCGCGKTGFKMQWDDHKRFGDTIIKTAGAPLLVDRQTKGYLQGGTIDYSHDMVSKGFRITTAASTGTSCGCGHSHS
ncbi:iron-sulfur cluster assembly accessory protein [Sulfobacillus sp. hq2]|uniref:HesB/IscA family protein n=1 Tax=Sulfobacillus sp. hq2 TaxID=2039167 RepID=UPI0013047E83|nr:iron-sulfur cluster biosynthesis family protein [Sulfobacillus sp. hq2]